MSTAVPSTNQALTADPRLDPERRDRLRGLLAGIVGALVLVAVVMLLRPFTGGFSIIDVLADATLLAMPIGLFAWLLETFGTHAKTLFLVGLIALFVLIGGGLGQLYAARTAGARRPMWARAQAYAIGIALGLGLVYLLVTDFVESAGPSLLRVTLALALGAEAWAIVTALLLNALRHRGAPPEAMQHAGEGVDRRRAIATGATGVAMLGALGVIGWDITRVANRQTVGGPTAGELPPPITPIDDFYVISKNFIDPDPDRGDDWGVEIEGLVERPGRISRAELEELAGPDFVSTLTCISNEIAGPLIGTARWTGAPLGKVLERAGVQPTAVDVVGLGEDGYTDSIPIEKALAPETHIVWGMNGEPLPRLHGTPVRLIVPGLYGIKNVKWLTKLSVVGRDYQGYWQERGWTDEAIIKTQSHFDVPDAQDLLVAGTHEIGGVAFAGDRGISKVEVSFDGGGTWREATIAENPGDAGLSWVIWKMDWQGKSGSYVLVVRATDGEGNLQTEEETSTLPAGASGYHRIRVGVA
ncbi:MAG TPA: molybdopterin-dependent oxidoreductase [Thermomicrobiales bacterium]|nr:molybdopterin-dependent oxidoreductase [Thermomicrobiales bacterium]